MIVCIGMYLLLIGLLIMKRLPRRIWIILFLSTTVSMALFLVQGFGSDRSEILRNSYGKGSKVEEIQYQIKGEKETETIQVEIFEQEYTEQEQEELFAAVMEQLDTVILGENESFDYVDQDLNLVNAVDGYPVDIAWEMDSYRVMDLEGKLREEHLEEQGTLVELRGIISYLDQQKIYVRNVLVYPKKLEGDELVRKELAEALQNREEETREEETFSVPEELNGIKLSWKKEEDRNGYYVLFAGIMLSVFLVYREKDQVKQAREKRRKQLLREYPGMVTKFHMLLNVGMTVRMAWEKIVQNYEEQKAYLGEELVYEEMHRTLNEIKGGIPEGEAYEHFGKRCELTCYLKFAAMLSQNLRKGSKGIAEMLRVEALQSFENRKNIAKKQGEEAGTKLLIPMIGMLAVVLIMVMVPAFLSLQI